TQGCYSSPVLYSTRWRDRRARSSFRRDDFPFAVNDRVVRQPGLRATLEDSRAAIAQRRVPQAAATAFARDASAHCRERLTQATVSAGNQQRLIQDAAPELPLRDDAFVLFRDTERHTEIGVTVFEHDGVGVLRLRRNKFHGDTEKSGERKVQPHAHA